MRDRFLVVVMILFAVIVSITPAGAQNTIAGRVAAEANGYKAPRTPDGQPDLQGYWTNTTYTPLQRPEGITRDFFTREEAIERYEIDRLNLEANPELSARQKARGLSARRTALKVELAKQGIYVGFPDESPGRRQFSRVPDVEAAIQSQGDAGQEEVR
jgi:hypothetical protein